MPKKPKGKVGVYFYVNEEIIDEFKRLTFSKHGTFHGALSHELEQAMRIWIALHTQNTQTNSGIEKVNLQPKTYEVFSQIKEYLKQRYGYAAIVPSQKIPRKHLLEAISVVRGGDERTIKRWVNEFQRFKLIKPLGEVFEVL
ncbi:hypothetical protein KEJ31_07175 [Candidatus Bathyarchaeota archaeon]|nr:hypothetical protein [Candidatus Bathyarchaeota archaeon]